MWACRCSRGRRTGFERSGTCSTMRRSALERRSDPWRRSMWRCVRDGETGSPTGGARPRAPGRAPSPANGARLSEHDGLSLLAEYGLETAASRSASSAEAAVEAATGIGFPVALKTAAPGITHKSDVDGVRVGLADADAVLAAYDDLGSRLGPDVTVAAMVPPGIEMALGVLADPTFGPLVLVGAGGVLVEVLHDRALALPPLDTAGARRLLDR